MPDTRLSALTALAAAPAAGDELYLRDISEPASAESKRITVDNLMAFYDADVSTISALKTYSADIIMSASAVRWSSGVAVVAAEYSIQRNADGTNQLHFNVPTGAGFEFSINDVAEIIHTTGAMAFQQATVVSAAGNLTLRASAGNDVLIGDDVTILFVDGDIVGGVGGIGVGTTPNGGSSFVLLDAVAYTAVANQNFGKVQIGRTNAITIPAGTTDIAAQFRVFEPNFIATGTINNAITVYIEGAPTEGGNNYALWVDDGTSRFDGDVDLNSTGTLLNVGAAGNDWTAVGIASTGTLSQVFTRTSAATTDSLFTLTLDAQTSGDAADGFGASLVFQFTDTGVTNQVMGEVSFVRDGADNTSRFQVEVNNAGTVNLAFRVDAAGELYADLDGTSGTYLTNGVNLFDDYDDALELRRFAYTQIAPWITEEQRLANRQRMEELGVTVRANSASGYMVRRTVMDRLLAGGIYQNRQRMDNYFVTVDERLTAMEEDNRILKEENHQLRVLRGG